MPNFGIEYLNEKEKEIEQALVERHGPERAAKLIAAINKTADHIHRHAVRDHLPRLAEGENGRGGKVWSHWHVQRLIDEHLNEESVRESTS